MATDRRIISHKLSLLKYARSINNISKACRESQVSRTTYYEYKKRHLSYGIAGLEDKQRTRPNMPNQTKKDIVDMVLSFAKKFPVYGVARIANELGNVVYAATVHRILKRNRLFKKFDRLLAMDDIPEDMVFFWGI